MAKVVKIKKRGLTKQHSYGYIKEDSFLYIKN